MKFHIHLLLLIFICLFAHQTFANQSENMNSFSPVLEQKFNKLYKRVYSHPQLVLSELDSLFPNNEWENNDSLYIHYMKLRFTGFYAQTLEDEMANIAKQVMNRAINSQSEVMMAEALFLNAVTVYGNAEYDLARDFTQQGLIIAKNLNNHELLVKLYNMRAVLNLLLLSHDLALEDFQKSLLYWQDDTFYAQDFDIKIFTNMSIIFMQLDQWQDAEIYNKKALDTYNKTKSTNTKLLGIIYINRAVISDKINDLEAGKYWLKRAEHIAIDSDDYHLQLNVIIKQLNNENRLNNFSKAILVAEKCIALAKTVKHKLYINSCNLSYGKTLLLKGEYQAALDLVIVASTNLQQLGLQERYIDSLELLAEIYVALDQHDLAYQIFKQYHLAIKDALFDKRQKQVFAMQAQFQTEAHEKELKLLHVEHQLALAEIKEQQLRHRFIIVFVGLLLLIGLYMLARHYQALRSNSQLKIINNQLVKVSHCDSLTGLKNRRYLEEKLGELTHLSELQTYTLVLLDLDHFKVINDSFGHDIGDEILIGFSQLMLTNIREYDELIRWGEKSL